MKKYLIGVAGKANSGKDTVAEIINYIFNKGITRCNYRDWICKRSLHKLNKDYRVIHFADNLKDILSILYNIPRNYFDDRKYKEDYFFCLETNTFIENNMFSNKNYNIIDISKLKENSIKEIISNNTNKFNCISIRTLMQYFGTDICRNIIDDNIWIKSALNKATNILEIENVCVIADVRFNNEAKSINNSSFYGGVILIERDNNVINNHISENIDIEYKYKIENNGNLSTLFYKCLKLITEITTL